MAKSRLGRRAKIMRGAHTLISAVELASLAHVWRCALTGRRDRTLRVSIAILSVEGVGLLAGRGDCPLGPLQQRVGDPVPLFELVLPPRAAKAAVPVLAATAVGGIAAVVIGQPAPRGGDLGIEERAGCG